MLLCPACLKITREVRITGPVLIAVGTIEVSDEGEGLTAVGPMTAMQTVKVGDELTAPGFTFTCLTCNVTRPREEFKVIFRCVFSGEATDVSVMTSLGVPVYVREEYVAEVARVFTKARSDGEAPLLAEELR